jgi:hypothetical protein
MISPPRMMSSLLQGVVVRTSRWAPLAVLMVLNLFSMHRQLHVVLPQSDSSAWLLEVLPLDDPSRTSTAATIAPVCSWNPSNDLSLCYCIASYNPMHWLTRHSGEVIAASQHPFDKHYQFESLTSIMWHEYIVPRLYRSVKALPATIGQTEESVVLLLEKIQARLQYLQEPNRFTDEPPPLSIIVLGGSVTKGISCHSGLFFAEMCAWPTRLEHFLNALVSQMIAPSNPNVTVPTKKFVTVEIMAIGGANTATGQKILDNDLIQHRPDILINAYSTNDMHAITMSAASKGNITLREKVFTMAQDFVRSFYQSQQCLKNTTTPTLLYWLDDYLGNEQREIMVTTQLGPAIQVLANYYGFGFVSYADAVRDIVYTDTTETMFSPKGWYTEGDPAMHREIHPGHAMHLATAWMVAFNLFSTLSTQCNVVSSRASVREDIQRATERQLTHSHFIRRNTPKMAGPSPRTMPPPLTADLTLETVSELWQNNSIAATSFCEKYTYQGAKRCPLSWISGMPFRSIKWITRFFEPFVQEPLGWKVGDTSNRKDKFGWIPLAGIPNATMILQLDSQELSVGAIRSITLFYMKSYGQQWQSAIEVEVEHQTDGVWSSAIATPIRLVGDHKKKTSEIYTETIELVPHHEVESMVRATITLVRGVQFKLMGLSVCQ